MKHKIIYILPLGLLLLEKNEIEIKDILIKMLYGLLTVNASLNNEIIIYTDFDGMSILSILPFTFNIIHSNTIEDFNEKVISQQKDIFHVILNENHILKMRTEFKENYIINSKINENAIINDIQIDDIILKLKDISETIYNKYLEKISEII